MAKKKNGKDPKKLTYKQRRFVEELPVDWHIANAAKRAGYSHNTAKNAGHQLMQMPKILDAIEKELQEQQKRTRISADRALEEMARIAFADLRQAFDENGNLKAPGDMPDDIARAIASIKVHVNPAKSSDEEEITYTKMVKFWDKSKMLDSIARYFNMYQDHLKVSAPDGGPIQHEHHVNFEQKLRDAKQKAQQARDGTGSESGECDS